MLVMDNYPELLAPEFDEGGGVATAFQEWWKRVQPSFPKVPEEVARFWLHEHWRHSPFSWLPSDNYCFEKQEWPSPELRSIRSAWCDFSPDNEGCKANGKHLIESRPEAVRNPTARYMAEHGDFPSPVIVLDNRDGHLVHGVMPTPAWSRLPAAFVLIEGHRRFNMALDLVATGRFVPKVEV
jgi:hypothetical protein